MSLWQMSVSGAVMIVVITVLRALLLERLPKRTFLVLWQIALARLLVPFSVPFGGSVYVLVQRGTQAVTGTNRPAAGPTLPGDFTAGMAAEAAAAPHPAAVQAVPVWAVIWLAGVLLLAAFFAAAYRRSWKKFQMSFPVEQPFARQWLQAHLLRRKITIRQCAFITSPLTFGVRHPVILLPKKTDWRDEATLQYVLEHEFVHIRRFDAVTKLLLTAAVCVHWPNPFVWVLYALANRDIEWWTYDEYKAWLDNEKVQLQSMLGERGSVNGGEEFVWTQEKIDETIALYEETLQDIKNGMMYSKTVDGQDDVLVVYDPEDREMGTAAITK